MIDLSKTLKTYSDLRNTRIIKTKKTCSINKMCQVFGERKSYLFKKNKNLATGFQNMISKAS